MGWGSDGERGRGGREREREREREKEREAGDLLNNLQISLKETYARLMRK